MRTATPLIIVAALTGTIRALRGRTSVPQVELRFRAPTGHDPAAALGALRRAGISAAPSVVGGATEIVITCLAGDRERVRAVLTAAPPNMSAHDVVGPPATFVDE